MASLLTAVKDVERLRQITAVLVRHGFGEVLGRTDLSALLPGRTPESDRRTTKVGERLRLALEELGPSFIKLGQIISTRSDLIPPDVIAELKKLQDDVPPISFAEVRGVVEEELGGTLDTLYASFDERPLACASIAQVHRARLAPEPGAEPIEVVVKVQRPRIGPTIERDLDLLYLLARVIERAVPESRVYSPVALVGEFDRAIKAELDFILEADNAELFTANFASNSIVRFPRVHRAASSKRVLSLEFFDGLKIDRAVASGASGETLAKNALAVIAQMIFEDGFFHGDPHPGNILVLGPTDAPVLGFLDLGLVGRLSPELRDKAVDLMIAVVRQDVDALAEALLAMGRARGPVDMAAFKGEVRTLGAKYLGRPIKEIQLAALVRDLVQGAVKYDIEMPSELAMVGKALMTIEGISKEIYPELDVIAELRPYFLRLLMRRYHPERVGRELLRGVADLSVAARTLPTQLHHILDDMRSGRLEIRTIDPSLPAAADRLGRRIYASLTVGAFTLAGAGLLAAGRHETLGSVLLALAGAQVSFHLLGDLRRRKRK